MLRLLGELVLKSAPDDGIVVGTMALGRELATYGRKRRELAGQAGKFVLIHGDDMVDCFGTYDDAIKAGYQQFGLGPFLVKLVDLALFPVFPPNRIIREGSDPVAKVTRGDVLTAIDKADASLAAGAGRPLTAESVRDLAEGVQRRGRKRLRDLFM